MRECNVSKLLKDPLGFYMEEISGHNTSISAVFHFLVISLGQWIAVNLNTEELRAVLCSFTISRLLHSPLLLTQYFDILYLHYLQICNYISSACTHQQKYEYQKRLGYAKSI